MTTAPSHMFLGSALAAALAGCSPHPTDDLRYQESWEVLAITNSGALLDVQATLGNTGLLRGQGHLRADLWPAEASAIRFARHVVAEDIQLSDDRSEFNMGPDGLEREGDSWLFRAQSDEVHIVLKILPGGTAPAMATTSAEGGQWTLSAPAPGSTVQGWFQSQERGGLVDARGVLLHHGGDGMPTGPRTGLFVLLPRLILGLEEQGGAHLAWGHLDGKALDTSAARLTQEGEAWTLDLRPATELVVSMAATGVTGTRLPHEHLNLAESAVMKGLGLYRRRTTTALHAIARIGPEPSPMILQGSAILLQVAPPAAAAAD